MDVIASENRAHAKGAQRALDILVDVAVKVHNGDKVFVFSFLIIKLQEDISCIQWSKSIPFNLSFQEQNDQLTKIISCLFILINCLFGFEQEKASALPVFDDLAERIYHCCFHKEWFIKAGGCCGISHLMHRLSITWIKRHYFEFIEALFYLLKVLSITNTLTHRSFFLFTHILQWVQMYHWACVKSWNVHLITGFASSVGTVNCRRSPTNAHWAHNTLQLTAISRTQSKFYPHIFSSSLFLISDSSFSLCSLMCIVRMMKISRIHYETVCNYSFPTCQRQIWRGEKQLKIV